MSTLNPPLDIENSLPGHLRGSKPPWKPVFEGQAPAPRDNDSWTCLLGPLRFELYASDYSWTSTNPNPGSLTFEMLLIYAPTDQQTNSWTNLTLEEASQIVSNWPTTPQPHQLRGPQGS